MIYLVRHGQTSYNKQGRTMGQRDIPLNCIGKKQSKEVAKILQDYTFDDIYSSPLKRTLKTAKYINKYHGLPIIKDDRLKEFYCGSFEGTIFDDHTEEEKDNLFNHSERVGSESRESVVSRVTEFLKDIKHIGAEKENILIVTHAGVINAIYNIMHKTDFRNGDWKWSNIGNTQLISCTFEELGIE